MSKEFLEMHAVVHGRVQGVGFRAVVRQIAMQLGVKGTVCNLPDGGVEIHAQGLREQLDALLDRVQKNLGQGKIVSIAPNYYTPSKYYDDFAIIYSSRNAVKN